MTSGGPRKGAGRKPLAKKAKRSVAVQVRLTREQKKWLVDWAGEKCSTVADAVYRMLIERGMPE